MSRWDGGGRELVIFGAGAQGLVVAEAAALSGWRVLGFLDDAERATPDERWPMLRRDDAAPAGAAWFVAIGGNAPRRQVVTRLEAEGREPATVVHPTAFISPSARLGPWVFVGPGAVVHSQAVLEAGVIVNSQAVVEHHNEVGAMAHIAPGAVLGGEVTVGRSVLVGLGARVLPGRTIGDNAIIGAGAVIVHDVPAGATAIGVPASLR